MSNGSAPQRRRANQLRPVRIERHFPTAAAGSVLITVGETRVLCTASISADVPPFLRAPDTGEPMQGWVTAEYDMLPAATPERQRRGPNSRATEIKRLIGRSLRAAVDLEKMPGIQITCDCDVVCADGGTRTAAITGAWVALADAVAAARSAGQIAGNPLLGPIAAVSVGVVDGKVRLDLDYDLDSRAEVDLNVVMNHRREFVELQGTAEGATFDREQLDRMLGMAGTGIRKLITAQRKALRGE
jgi:ribonuclease PH